jgi:hypothetical protein
MKTGLLIIVVLACFAGLLAAQDLRSDVPRDIIKIPVPNHVADLIRVVVLAQAGIALGFMFRIVLYFYQAKLDKNDRLLYPTATVCMIYVGCVFYIAADLASRLDFDGKHFNTFMTWRTPLAFVLFGASDIALYVLKVRLSGMIGRAIGEGATVKVTMTDTSKPGPDIDLADQTPVIKPSQQ